MRNAWQFLKQQKALRKKIEWRGYGYPMNKCVLVTGSTGMIGRALCSELRRQGFALRRLLRSGDVDEVESFHWDPLSGFLDPRVLEGVSAVVHLAGEPIAQRWNNQAKARILASRIRSTEVLVEAMRLAESTADFIVSSGINYYGSNAGRTGTQR